jgi:hypothetical protein
MRTVLRRIDSAPFVLLRILHRASLSLGAFHRKQAQVAAHPRQPPLLGYVREFRQERSSTLTEFAVFAENPNSRPDGQVGEPVLSWIHEPQELKAAAS